MLLIPIYQPNGEHILEAYSYSESELDAVSVFLARLKLAVSFEQLPIDDRGRQGRRFRLSQTAAARVERRLSFSFELLAFMPTMEAGKSYRCDELSLDGPKAHCADLVANDREEAIVKCALLANQRGWLGGVASPGTCKRK